jgi:hypothetical protein
VANPYRFVPRYWRALQLVTLILRFGERSPGTADRHPVASKGDPDAALKYLPGK